MLNEYYTQPNDKLWNIIENNDISTFKSILTKNNHSFSITMIIKRVLQSHMKFEIDTPAFLQFRTENDGKLNLKQRNIQDYSVIIAYCTETSDFETLKLIIDTIDKSKYNLTALFTHRQLWGPNVHGLIDSIDHEAYDDEIVHLLEEAGDMNDLSDQDRDFNDEYTREPWVDLTGEFKWSLLHSCITYEYEKQSKIKSNVELKFKVVGNTNENEKVLESEALDCIDDNGHDDSNYKCFEYLATKTGIIAALVTDMDRDIRYNKNTIKLVNKCFDNVKPKFVECLIKHGLLSDYTSVLLNICKVPQSWKLKVLKMLLCDCTYERYFDIFSSTDDHNNFEDDDESSDLKPINIYHNCLLWCLNIGLSNREMITKLQELYFNSDEIADFIDSAFECFKLILQGTRYKPNDINRLVNERMEMMDDIDLHIAELCTIMAHKNSKYINYLIENNGKYDWKIDFRQTNVLQFASLVGNYKIFEAVLTKYTNRNTDCSIEYFGCILQDYDSFIINQFSTLELYKKKLMSTMTHNPGNLFFWCINTTNTIVCSKDTDKHEFQTITHLDFDKLRLLCTGYLRNGGCAHDNNISNIGIEYPDNLASIVLRFVDLRYGNRQCFQHLLDNYYDSEYRNNNYKNRYKNNVKQKNVYDEIKHDHDDEIQNESIVSLYPTSIQDCVKNCRIDLITILFNKWKQRHYALYSSDGKTFYQLVQCAFHMVCFSCNSAMVKLFLKILSDNCSKNSNEDEYFDINEILHAEDMDVAAEVARSSFHTIHYGVAPSIFDFNLTNHNYGMTHVESKSTSTSWPPHKSGTPLMMIVQSNIQETVDGSKKINKSVFSDINELIDYHQMHEPLECVKLLLSQPGIDIHKACDDETAFLLAIDAGKLDLVECLTNHWNNGPTKNIKNEMKCLENAVKKQNFEIVQLVIENIGNMFSNKQIKEMCKNILETCVNSADFLTDDTDVYRNMTHPSSVFYKTFVLLLSAPQLIKDVQTGKRLVVVTKNVIDGCLTRKQFGALKYVVENYADCRYLTQNAIIRGRIKKEIAVASMARDHNEFFY